jgi:RpiR family carbohydrate utilization transcriptional regulator
LPKLRKSEAKVAQYVLAHPNVVVQSSIAVLANEVMVSEPTVIRFCRAVGCKGFQDLKLQLAKSLATGIRYFHRDFAQDDVAEDLPAKIFDRTISVLIQVRNALNTDTLQQAIDCLATARRIDFYGLGASGIVAADAQHKFLRFNIPVAAYADPYLQRKAVASLGPGCAVVAICDAGCYPELLHNVELARAKGADVIAITVSTSRLVELGTVVLSVDIPNHEGWYEPMTSRIAHLALLDALEIGVALRHDPATLDERC